MGETCGCLVGVTGLAGNAGVLPRWTGDTDRRVGAGSAIPDSCADISPGLFWCAGDSGDGVEGSIRRFGFDVRVFRGNVDAGLMADGGDGE
jgi:hypothetical protein